MQPNSDTHPMVCLIILFVILVVVVFALSLYMHIREKRTGKAPFKSYKTMHEVPSYALSSWVDDEVAARQLYRKPDMTASELADELGLPEMRLIQVIRAAHSKTVTEYLNDRRIQSACRLLREQAGMTIEDIVTEVGFDSPSTFLAIFVRAMGQTPKQYRSQMTRYISDKE